MSYSIKEAATIMNLPQTTLRYYDHEGLLPFLERSESGYRLFSEDDMSMLRVIECLKKAGMSIKDIKKFTDWIQEGDISLQKRYQLFLERKKVTEAQIADLNETLNFISYKCKYYEKAIAAGTEKIHFNNSNNTFL